MSLSAFCKLALIALILGMFGPSRAAGPDAPVMVTGKLLAVQAQPGCGLLKIGSAATYAVISGPANLQGKQITVVVHCIELPQPKGDVLAFVPGAMHQLTIGKTNFYQIEHPSRLPEPSWFYLRAANSIPES